MEENKISIKQIIYNHGLYLAMLSIIILVIMYAFDLEKNWIISSLSFILTVLIFVFGINMFKSQNNGFLKLSEAIKIGLGIAAIGGIITALYTYVHYSYIYPEFIDKVREESITKMMEINSNLTGDVLDKAIEMNKMFTSPFAMSTFTLIGNLILGIIISLVAGLIMKKKPDTE